MVCRWDFQPTQWEWMHYRARKGPSTPSIIGSRHCASFPAQQTQRVKASYISLSLSLSLSYSQSFCPPPILVSRQAQGSASPLQNSYPSPAQKNHEVLKPNPVCYTHSFQTVPLSLTIFRRQQPLYTSSLLFTKTYSGLRILKHVS